MHHNIKGPVKAAYIYNILPRKIKSTVLNQLPRDLAGKLDKALKEIQLLDTSKKKFILNEFVGNVVRLKRQREAMFDRAVIYSISLLLGLLLSTFTIALYKYSTIDTMIYFVELILNNGGIHLIFAPLLYSYIKSMNESPLDLIISSKNYLLDTAIAVVCSLFITGILLSFSEHGSDISYFKIATLFTLPLTITIGPAMEELFFRFMLFYKSGKKIGYPGSAFISSLIFSAIHIPDSFLLFVVYFLIGILLCVIYYYRKSLFPSFISHALSNLLIQIF